MLAENEKDAIGEKIITRFRQKVNARKIFAISDESCLPFGPVIHKELVYNPHTVDNDVEMMTDALSLTEDTLFFTGDHHGWPALGIEGLATATGRHRLRSGGRWPKNMVNDITNAKEILVKEFSIPPVLILSDRFKKLLTEQVEVKLIEGGLSGVITTHGLYTKRGIENNALLVVPNKDYFWAIQDISFLGWPVTVWYHDNQTVFHFREIIRPIIGDARAIVEITGIRYTTLK